MSGRYVLSPRAQVDLDQIWDYTAERWGFEQAESYIRRLWEDIKAVATRPAIGRACPEVRAGYYKYRSGSHFLFYRSVDNGVDIVRILHERMDFAGHL
jgi:toxin ParE1/3/4